MRIEGTRVLLRDFEIDDVAAYAHWNMPGHHWQEFDGPYYARPSADDVNDMAGKLRAAIESGVWPDPRMRLAIAHPQSNELMGVVTSYWESEETNWLSIGIVIFDERNWGGGIGTESLKLWVDYLFRARPEIVRLDARTWSGNTGMMALAKKLGFIEEACFRKARIVNGEYYDGLAYGVLRDEWESRGE